MRILELVDASNSPMVAEGPLHGPIGEAASLAKSAVANPRPTPKTGHDGATADVDSDDASGTRTTVVQFSILFDGDEEKFAHLWAMRDVMHRILNTAFSEWRRADKVPSKRNPKKETLDRGGVTQAVKALLVRENEYWAKQIDARQAAVERARVSAGGAKSKRTPSDAQRAEAELAMALRKVQDARIRAEIKVPSSVYDAAVRFTQSRLVLYRKEEFRGTRAADSFTSGQPIRWRDGSWEFTTSEKRGHYRLTLQIGSDGRRVRRGLFDVIPDGPSMHGFAKRMVSGEVRLCDARVVYSERKKQWFAKLTIRYPELEKPAKAEGVASLRRGMHNAFVLAFENDRTEFITGADVVWFKRKLKARKVAVQKHTDRLEAGTSVRGRGKARRDRGIRKIHDSENRFVDWRIKTWAAAIAKLLVARGVGTLFVASMGKADMFDGDDYVQALLYQWPFAKMLDWLKQTLAKVGIEVKEYSSAYNARRCPNFISGKRCGHVNPPRSGEKGEMFVCEVCGFDRPADAIVALNGLSDARGPGHIESAQKRLEDLERKVKNGKRGR